MLPRTFDAVNPFSPLHADERGLHPPYDVEKRQESGYYPRRGTYRVDYALGKDEGLRGYC